MADSDQRWPAGRELVTRGVYFEPPFEIVPAFLQHVRDTGQPETFPTISTAKPPTDGDMKVLHHPVDVNPKLRPNLDLAPCPICSPQDPKFMSGGSLIWCEATKAIYAIGPRCSDTLWGKGRLDRAINVFNEAERIRRNKARLAATIRCTPRLQAWGIEHRNLARRADAEQANLMKSAPRWARAISFALKSAGASTPAISGAAFLRGHWTLQRKLHDGAAGLGGFLLTCSGDPDAWAEGLAPSVVSERLRQADQAIAALAFVHDRLAAASAFLAEDNLIKVCAWSKLPSAPINFTAVRTAASIEVRTGIAEEIWRGRIGFPPPGPLPMVSV